MAYVICEPCVDVKDTACVKVCPVDCIYEFEGERQLYIHPQECIDCGACMPECPVQAIFTEATVPDQWRSYIEKNRVIFETRTVTKASGEIPAESAPTTATAPRTAPVRVTELSRERVLRILQAVEEGTLDAEIALLQFVGTPTATPIPPVTPAVAAPAPTASAAKPVSKVDPRVPAAVAERVKVVPAGYGGTEVGDEDEEMPLETAPIASSEPPLPRPELQVRGVGAFLLRVLQPVLGALRAKEKYLLEGYAGSSVFSASFATWSNAALNLFVYWFVGLGLAAMVLGEGWESSGLVNVFLLLSTVFGVVEGSVRIWNAMFDASAPAHRQYRASLYGWLVNWLVWPIVEAAVRPAARKPQADVLPPQKAIPGGEVHLEDEIEKRRRYGMVHSVIEEDREYLIRLEMPRKTPITSRKARFKLPDDLPDYRIEVWSEGSVVNVRAILDDPRFAEVAGRDPGFPASFLTMFKLEGATSQVQQEYDAEQKVLTIRVGKTQSEFFLENAVAGAHQR
jgi:NAD-dependent dihydropyrimidine dehydrogenase PreA subunit